MSHKRSATEDGQNIEYTRKEREQLKKAVRIAYQLENGVFRKSISEHPIFNESHQTGEGENK